jgi:hypothetical protein
LQFQKLAPDGMHGYATEFLVLGCDQRHDVDAGILSSRGWDSFASSHGSA